MRRCRAGQRADTTLSRKAKTPHPLLHTCLMQGLAGDRVSSSPLNVGLKSSLCKTGQHSCFCYHSHYYLHDDGNCNCYHNHYHNYSFCCSYFMLLDISTRTTTATTTLPPLLPTSSTTTTTTTTTATTTTTYSCDYYDDDDYYYYY